MAKKPFEKYDKDSNHIPGIYNYCDRWCERCQFTSRCLNFEMSEEKFDDLQGGDISNEVFWRKLSETLQETMGMLQEMEVSSSALRDLRIVKGRGCDWCAHTGYKGRSGIYELLPVSDEVRQLILERADSKAIKEKARSHGMKTLREAMTKEKRIRLEQKMQME